MESEQNNEKLQELTIIVADKIRSIGKFWWYGLAAGILAAIPSYYIARKVFVGIVLGNHKFPAYIYQDETKVPLQISDKKIFKLGGNAYAGYFKIRNSSNYDWGAPDQAYTVTFSTAAGTQIARFTKSTFVLPSSEKIVVLPRFTSEKEPSVMDVVLSETQFVHKPNRPSPNLEIEKVNLVDLNGGFVVSAELKNKTPFTIRQIGLPVLLYDKENNIVGANYTSIDQVLYAENRSFQFSWPANPSAVRAEILPEVNIFDSGIYDLSSTKNQFDSTSKTQ